MKKCTPYFRHLLWLLCCLPFLAHAADDTWALSFKPPQSDISVIYLQQLFGIVDGVLYGTGSQIMGKIFGVFNSAVLTLGGIVLTYVLIVSTFRNSEDGEQMGRKWSSGWIPARSALGVILLIPKASGYCMIQVFVMWVIIQGVGAADKLWNTALDYLQSGGIFTQPNQSSVVQTALNVDKGQQAARILESLVCLNGLQRVLDGTDTSNTPSQAPDLVASVDFLNPTVQSQATKDAPGIYSLQLPSNLPGQFAALNGVCGKITWKGVSITQINTLANNLGGGTPLDTNDPVIQQAEKTRNLAVKQMYDDLNTTARLIVGNYFTTPDAKLPLGTCGSTCTSTNVIWQSGSDKPPLLTGYEIRNSVNAYYAIMNPTLNALGRELESLDFMSQARADGWASAGAYFYDLVSLNRASSATTTDIATLKATPPISISTIDSNSKISYRADGLSRTFPGAGSSDTYEFEDFAELRRPFDELVRYIKDAQSISARGTETTPGAETAVESSLDFSIPRMRKYEQCNLRWCMDDGAINLLRNTIVNPVIIPALNLVAGAIASVLSFAINIWADFSHDLFKTTEQDLHPILAIAKVGNSLIDAGGFTWLAGIVASLISGLVPFNQSVIAVFTFITPLISIIIGSLYAAGILLAFWIPIIPYIVFLMGVLGWFVAVIEAMVAAPIVAVGMLHPESRDEFLGKGHNALMLLANVFLRPSMMIIGYIAAIILSYIAVWLLIYTFGIISTGVLSQIGSANIWAKLFGPLFLVLIFAIIYLNVIQETFKLITIVPDRVLRWLGGAGAGGPSFGDQAVSALKSGISKVGETSQETAGALTGRYRKKEDNQGDSGSTIKGGKGGGGQGGGAGGLQSPSRGAKPKVTQRGGGPSAEDRAKQFKKPLPPTPKQREAQFKKPLPPLPKGKGKGDGDDS